MRRVSSKTVYLTELQRFIFTDEYTPQLGPKGEHELRFTGSEGEIHQQMLMIQLLISMVQMLRISLRALMSLRAQFKINYDWMMTKLNDRYLSSEGRLKREDHSSH